MTVPRRKRSWSSLLLATSKFGNFLFPLIRGVALARLLSKQEFGVAISITVVAGIVDLISDIGLNQFAMRVADARSLPTLHSLSLIRSGVIGCLIALGGPLFAWLAHAPETAPVYTLVGLAIAIRGFTHLGVKAAMRAYNFIPEATTELSVHVSWTIVTVASAWFLRDYMSMVFGLIACSVVMVLVSHLLAGSRWSLGWDREIIAEALRFGRPLVPNGAALAALNMGDRALIGTLLGPAALAYYSVLSTSAFTPRSAIVGFLGALVTPQFVNTGTREQDDRLLVVWTMIITSIAASFAFGYMAFGQPLIAIVFGERYAVDETIVALIAVLSAVRYVSFLVNPPSIAKGQTSMVLLNTGTASTGLVVGLGFAVFDPTIHALVLGMCVGELFGLLIVLRRLLVGYPAVGGIVARTVASTMLLVLGCAIAVYAKGTTSFTVRAGICGCFAVTAAVLLVRELGRGRSTIRDVAKVLLPAH